MTTAEARRKIEKLKAGRRLNTVEEVTQILAAIEDHLLSLAERHETLFTNGPVPLFEVDATGRVTAQNDRATEWFHRGDHQGAIFVGSIVAPEDRATFAALLDSCRNDGTTRSLDVRVRGSDDITRLARITARPSSVSRTVNLAVVDIDDLKQTELRLDEDLRRHRAFLRETNHRTKNLLQMIRSSVEIKARSAESADARHIARTLAGQVASLQGAVSALTTGGEVTHIDAVGLLYELMQHLSAGLSDGVDIQFLSGEHRLLLSAESATSLSLVVAELCFNAVEHAFPHGEGGTVTVTLETNDDHIIAVVKDDGIGFDGNTGDSGRLGLVIVRDLIERHLNGTVGWMPTKPGTEARVTFPLQVSATDEE